jgi:putative protease
MCGVCSPASHVRYEERGEALVSLLGGHVINVFEPGEAAGYPTLCKGRYRVDGRASYLFEEPTSLNVITLLPELAAAGVSALKIEGRQRGTAYVARVVGAFRAAIDACQRNEPIADFDLHALTEGQQATAGAYRKGWR